MAKMRIGAFAKEIDISSNEVIACLEELGITGKKAQSSIEDDEQEKVKERLSKSAKAAGSDKDRDDKKEAKAAEEKKTGVKKADEKKADEKKTDESAADEKKADEKKADESAADEKKADEKKADEKRPEKKAPAEKTETPEKPQAPVKPERRETAEGADGRPVQKKKKPNIIFVSNPHNSQSRGRTGDRMGQGGGRGMRPSDNQGRMGSTSGRPNTSQLIRPNVPRSQTHLLYQEEKHPVRPDAGSAVKPEENVNLRDNNGGDNNQTVKDNTQEIKQSQGRFSHTNRDGGSAPYDNNRTSEHKTERGQRGVTGRDQGNAPQGRDRRDQRGPAAGPAQREGEFPKDNDQHRNDQRHKNIDKHKKDQSYMNEDGFKGGKQVKGTRSKLERPSEKKQEVKEEEKIKVITLPEVLTIKELADKMKVQPAVIIKKLFMQGKVVTVNQEISYEQAEEIAVEFDILCEKEEVVDVIEELLKEEEDDTAKLVTRPPVICVMGHVDHGKTSLLDAIRSTHVIDKEAGGITQHIGAYVVNTQGRKITFLDTPGHEAFTAMRMRGANSTDIAILVVAADDGVMPQTVEAINHAKAAGIEIIVAVNKIDKPSANIDRVKQELSEYNLIPEDWGGSTVFAPVSAKTGEGIDQLLEMILLTADIMELKADPKRKARGLVIEAELDKGRGPVATVLVQKGTLKVGDFIACGPCHGKVRAMIDDKGKRVKEAGPSTPVEILGLNDVPGAGEIFISPDNDKDAKQFAETFISQNRIKLLDDTKRGVSLDNLFDQIKTANLKELNLIVKADVQGSVEAVKESLVKLSNDEVLVKVIHGGVGAINESDVVLAGASNAIIIGFNVRPDATAKGIAETEGVDIRLYNVIYKAIEDVEAAMKGMLDPVFEEKIIGHAEIRQIFKASGIGNIAGSYVLDGQFTRGCKVRIRRGDEQIYEGALASLKRFKDDVKEVKAGFECGLVFEGFNDIAEFDIVEAYIMVEVPR
ncbi:MAG: translation initiation factor IF-2 [Lachnospiraceae bacterium]|nr:translation initiation factor IF-2 [Lachnospiraceae bacterium]